MKRLAALLAALILASAVCRAAPLPLGDDLADVVTVLFDESDPDGGKYVYSYCYPHIDESDPDAYLVNEFYEYEVSDTLDFRIPMDADYWASMGEDASKSISYTLTCNNDEYFSLLLRIEDVTGDFHQTAYSGHTFSRLDGKPGSTITLPQILGILAVNENDSWLQDRQTEKADQLIRDMIWEMVEDNPDDIPYYDDFTSETFAEIFYPEEDFYLDENGSPVFFIQPGAAADDSAGLLTYPISLEDILDEM